MTTFSTLISGASTLRAGASTVLDTIRPVQMPTISFLQTNQAGTTMANLHEYVCTRCGTTAGREDLVVKRVQFVLMGEGASTIKSRVVAWLCPPCTETDEDFIRDKFIPPRAVAHV